MPQYGQSAWVESRSCVLANRSLQNPHVSSQRAPRIMPSKRPRGPVSSLGSMARTLSWAMGRGYVDPYSITPARGQARIRPLFVPSSLRRDGPDLAPL